MKTLKDVIYDGLTEEQIKRIDDVTSRLKLGVAVVERLRGPNGCPWDREQDHLTLRPYLIEEAYEALETLDQFVAEKNPKAVAKETPHEKVIPPNGKFSEKDLKDYREEMGDVLLQVLFHAQISAERGDCDVGDIAEALSEKLVSRHPHVFDATKVSGSDQVLENWEKLKKKEGRESLLDGLPKNLPSLQRAARVSERVKRVGFDWPDWQGAWEKTKEEVNELFEAIQAKDKKAMEHEMGDVFLAFSNLARHLKLQPEDVHREAVERFEFRFRKLEEEFKKRGQELSSASLDELESVWQSVK